MLSLPRSRRAWTRVLCLATIPLAFSIIVVAYPPHAVGQFDQVPGLPNQFERPRPPGQAINPIGAAADALGNATLSYAMSVFLMILDFLLWLLMWFFGILISLVGKSIDLILLFDKLAGAPAVQTAWQFVRDMLNFVFILALLVIAFATIAGIESYNIKKLLPQLLIAALLVNFSLAIAGAFLQVGNVLAGGSFAYLGNNNRTGACREDAAGRRVGSALTCYLVNSGGIATLYTYGGHTLSILGMEVRTFSINPDAAIGLNTERNAGLRIILAKMVALVFLIIFYFSLVVLSLLLAIRIAVLIFLLILSPVPYVASIVPKTSAWATKWWDNFLRYVFFYPAIVFFLSISIVLAGQVNARGEGGILEQIAREGALNTIPQAGRAVFVSMFQLFIVSMFIIVAVYVAKALSIAGAEGAVGLAKNLTKLSAAPAIIGARAVGYGLKRVSEKAPKTAAGVSGAIIGGLVGGPAGALIGAGLGAGGKTQVGGTIIQTGKALYTGEEGLQKQIAEAQKPWAGRDKAQQRRGVIAGNLGAVAQAAKDGNLETEEEFEVARRVAPRGSKLREDINKAYAVQFPSSRAAGISHTDLTKNLAEAGKPTATSAAKEQLVTQHKTLLDAKNVANVRKNISKIKNEDLEKPEQRDEVRAALAAARYKVEQTTKVADIDLQRLPVDLTPGSITKFSERLDEPGRKELTELLKALDEKGRLEDSLKTAAKRRGVYTPPKDKPKP